MTKFLTKILLLCSCIVFQAKATQIYSIEDYYAYTNKAELCITDSKYLEAIDLYQKAFKTKHNGFSKDHYNAALCAALTGKYYLANLYVKKILNRGYPIDSLSTSRSLKSFRQTKYWKSIVREYPTILKRYRDSTNKILADSLDLLYYRDQLYRTKLGKYKLYGDTIRKIDIENDRLLRNIIATYGYPNEKIIGSEKSLSPRKDFDLIIWHQTSLNFIYDYSSLLIKEVNRGNIDPHRAAELIDNQRSDMSLYGTELFYRCTCDDGCSEDINRIIKNKLYYFTISEKRLTTLNQNRKQIHLETIEEYRKKVLFNLRDRRFAFFYLAGIPTYSFKTDADLLQFIGNMKFIDEDDYNSSSSR